MGLVLQYRLNHPAPSALTRPAIRRCVEGAIKGGTMTGRGKSVYFKDDKLWAKAQKFAKRKGLSVSDWIRDLITKAMKEG